MYSILNYINERLESNIGLKLVVVLDPNSNLNFENKYIDISGKEWGVYKYTENDISFRKIYSARSIDPNYSHIVWVTYPSDRKKGKIDLSYIGDILNQAELVLDLRVDTVLKNTAPDEIWPDTVIKYEKEISSKIGSFFIKHDDLRKSIGKEIPLNKNHILTLILASRYETIPLSEFIFKEKGRIDIMYQYMKLLFRYNMQSDDYKLIDDISKDLLFEGRDNLVNWIGKEKEEIAIIVSLLPAMKMFKIDNPINQLRGIGVLSFDPKEIEESVSGIIDIVKKDIKLFDDIILTFEQCITEGTINNIFEDLPIMDNKEFLNLIMEVRSPLIIFYILKNYLKKLIEEKGLIKEKILWTKELCSHLIFRESTIKTKFLNDARSIMQLFKEIQFIISTIDKKHEKQNEIINILNFYEKNRIYNLKLSITNAKRYLKVIDDKVLSDKIIKYLDNLDNKIEEYLERIDLNLADIINSNIKDYYCHPRLSINIISDYVVKRQIVPSDERKIWILIFDGMRYDTWKEVVRPALEINFEVSDEKPYLCPLPSYTDVARISLLAGMLPPWKSYKGEDTSDHNILASKLLNLSQSESRNKLKITTASETDYAQRRLDFSLSDYNILIYNMSDDWIHSFRGDIHQLNETIRNNLVKFVLPDLEDRIKAKDSVLITSDHGFIELMKEKEIKVTCRDEEQVVYRYLKNIEHKNGVKIQYIPSEYFTVCKGRSWFSREHGKFTRYTHGGISLDEMVIPAAVVKKIVSKNINFELDFERKIEVIEDNSFEIVLAVKNTGNIESSFSLMVKPDFKNEEHYSKVLKPKEIATYSINYIATLQMKKIEYILKYEDINKKPIERVGNSDINVIKKEDKFEISKAPFDLIDRAMEKKK